MVITQGLTIHDYINVISDVWKAMYSSTKPVTNTQSIHDFNGKLIIFKTKHKNFSPYFTRTVPVIVGFPCQCWSRILASFSIQ
jgi:hypothetical protein